MSQSMEPLFDEKEPILEGMVPYPVIPKENRFELSEENCRKIREVKYSFGFDGFGETVYYRSFSRKKDDGSSENWHDTVIRVINGNISIRKDHAIRGGTEWKEKDWQKRATEMAIAFVKMWFLPPGRGLWASGTEFMYTRGAAALNNCGFVSTEEKVADSDISLRSLTKAAIWMMDMLMCGAGIGFDTLWRGKVYRPTPDSDIMTGRSSPLYRSSSSLRASESYSKIPTIVTSSEESNYDEIPHPTPVPVSVQPAEHLSATPSPSHPVEYKIHDSREGWVKSVMLLLNSYTIPNHPPVTFDYSLIRPAGRPIKIFGGTSSGYEPLARLHKLIRAFFECYLDIHSGDATTGKLVDPWSAVKEMVRKTEDAKTYTYICGKLDEQKSFCNRISKHDTSLTIDELKKRTDFYYISDIYRRRNSSKQIDTSTDVKSIFASLEEKDFEYLFKYSTKTYDHVRLVADIFNAIGCCVVAGNVRRSSEIALGSPDSLTFYNLKNYDINPERMSVGWMSNNTVILKETKDFNYLPALSQRMKQNGEPGICNMINVKYGRIGRNKHVGREDELDKAIGLNPCITGDTKILTSEGLKEVKELVGTQFNAIVNGKPYSSTKDGFWSTGVKQTYKVTLENGMNIRATENHKFLMKYDNSFSIWKELNALKINDQMVIHNNKTENIDYAKILSIVIDAKEEVYDCTIDIVHCMVGNGMYIHNCSEISLESFELCNLAEVFPTRCGTPENIMTACEYAITYTSNNSLARTHWSATNEVIARNRRNGISFSGISEFYETTDNMKLTRILRDAYDLIRSTNARLNSEAGVPAALRVTTIKPSGSISQLAGVSSGIHFPIHRYALRAIRIDDKNPMVKLLTEAGYYSEKDERTPNTLVFYFPIFCGTGRTAKEVTMWEQAMLSIMFQREYVDNSISQTLYFDPITEGSSLEKCLAQIAPQIKTISVLPREVDEKVYRQAPYTKITEERYNELRRQLKPINWSKYTTAAEPEMPSGCSNDVCELKSYKKNPMKEEKKS